VDDIEVVVETGEGVVAVVKVGEGVVVGEGRGESVVGVVNVVLTGTLVVAEIVKCSVKVAHP
jgi:hypothetical protein